MNTLLIEVRDDKAYEALREFEEQKVIKVLKEDDNQKMNASSFRGGLHLTEKQYRDFQNHITEIRNEWRSDI